MSIGQRNRGTDNLTAVVGPLKRVWRFIRTYRMIIWPAVLITLLGLLIWRSQDEIVDTGHALANANPLWLLLGLLLQSIILCFAILVLGVLLVRLGHRPGAWSVIRAHFQRVTVGNLAPVSGPASAAAYASFLSSRGVPTGDAILSLVLNGLASYGSLVLFGVPALVIVLFQYDVALVVLVAVPVLITGFAGMVYSLLFLFRDSGLPHSIVSRIPHRAYEYIEEVRSHRIGARDLVRPTLLSLPVKVLGAVLFYVSLVAIGHDPPVSAALAGFATATLFRSVVIPFGGFGFVELGAIVVLQEFGISVGDALAATLLYRLAEFWYPLAIGLLLQATARR